MSLSTYTSKDTLAIYIPWVSATSCDFFILVSYMNFGWPRALHRQLCLDSWHSLPGRWPANVGQNNPSSYHLLLLYIYIYRYPIKDHHEDIIYLSVIFDPLVPQYDMVENSDFMFLIHRMPSDFELTMLTIYSSILGVMSTHGIAVFKNTFILRGTSFHL